MAAGGRLIVAGRPFTVIGLCAGIGALERGVGLAVPYARSVCYVEREAFPVEVLATGMDEGAVAQAPVWTDLTTFDGRPWRGRVDGIVGGLPCQPFSQAGRLQRTSDDRWLWDHVIRIIDEVEPSTLFFENVPGLRKQGLRRIIGDLAARGFDAEWDVFTAQQVGAPHIRQRLFVLAHRHDARCGQRYCPAVRDQDARGGVSVASNSTSWRRGGR